MKKVVSFLIVCIILAASGYTAHAEKLGKARLWYGKFGMGYVEQVKNYSEVNVGETEWHFDHGFNFNVAVGISLDYLALEGEVSYKKMDIDRRINTNRSPGVRYTGDQTHIAMMANAYLIPKPEWIISPYLGLGIGNAIISWNDIRAPGSSSAIDDTDVVFAYQFIVGASYDITEFFTLQADYRYFVPSDAEIELSDGTAGKFTDQELNIFNIFLKFKI
jgi:opacity protein-like surface antigen